MTDGDHIVGMCALTCADDPMLWDLNVLNGHRICQFF